jgi:hypothetical protein
MRGKQNSTSVGKKKKERRRHEEGLNGSDREAEGN